ncbi:MAG: 4'-phosphopantetheinyl transferase family protein [Bacteroidota bacterium]
MDAKDNRSLDKTGDGPAAWHIQSSMGLWSMALVAEVVAQSWSQSRVKTIALWPDRPQEPVEDQQGRYGQWLASRTALYSLIGDGVHGLARQPEGRPLLRWNHQRVPVSLTHTAGMGGAVVATPGGMNRLVGLGVDLERCSDRHARVLGRVCGEDEIRRVHEIVGDHWGPTLLWVLKEAAYKCNLIDGIQFGKNQEITKINKNTEFVQNLEEKERGDGLKCLWNGVVVQGPGGKDTTGFEAGYLLFGGDTWIWAVAYSMELMGNDHS